MEEKNDFLLLTNQRAILSQSLQYSLNLLRMNNLDLREHIKEVLQENPFLKEDADFSSQDYDHGSQNTLNIFENLPDKFSLKKDLEQQMSFLNFTDFEKEIAETIVDIVKENRYIASEFLKEISREKNISYFEILAIINRMKMLSPIGLFAFNFQDKIKSVLEAAGEYDHSCANFIQNIDMAVSYGLPMLQKKCGMSDLKLSKMISLLKNLDFSCDFFEEDAFVPQPDIIIEEKNKNNFEGIVNTVVIPKISIDEELFKKSTKAIRTSGDKEYVKEQIKSAELLIKSINYRNSTLMKVMKEVIYRQQDFFIGNTTYLTPISVRDISNSLLLHESTVRRAISEKIVVTPRGTFEMKALLPKEIKSANNEDVLSEHSIKEYIKVLINDEPRSSPYSDNNIVYFLNSHGIEISRRTVSKYRNILDIPNVSHRSKIYKVTSRHRRD